MTTTRANILVAAAMLLTLLLPQAASASVEPDAASIIKDTIGSQGSSPEIYAGGRIIRVTRMMQRFYKSRNYMPAWSSQSGTFADLYDLIDAVEAAYEEGLNPEDYPSEEMAILAKALGQSVAAGEQPDPVAMANLDLLATDTFLSIGYHLLAGRIYPEITDGEWSDYVWDADLDKILHEALQTGRVQETLKSLVPPYREYSDLREALAYYREIANVGGWPLVPYGGTLRLGVRSRRVPILRERLMMSGDLAYDYETTDKNLFEGALQDAVVSFQKRHGLEPDGAVGPNTLAAMNVPVQARIEQLELNMERWRWLPEDLGDRYIFVNTAAFELKVVDHGNEVMRMRIVVGKPYWHTPSFSAKMTYLVINPAWNVPASIAVEDILPDIMKDSGYLEKEGLKVITGGGEKASEVDPKSIDWSKVTADNMGFRFVQPPGPKNPLGRLKFMFPNRFNVYLHDTPSKGLFRRAVRTFSHGCIRIEEPIKLATYLVPGLTEADVKELIKRGDELKVPLPEPIMVHSLYWTAWVDPDGAINFRDDIYGRDEALVELLKYGPMTP